MLSRVIAALYCDSDYRSVSRIVRHTQILSCLRRNLGEETSATWKDVIDALRKENFSQEALFLSEPHQQAKGMALIDEGRVLTIACKNYPPVLLANLTVNAPPLFWISTPNLRESPPWFNDDGSQRVCMGGIGCRTPLAIGHAIATRVGNWVGDKQFLGVSGGAVGCDEAFGNGILDKCGSIVHILPHGLDKLNRNLYGYAMTVCPPGEAFSAGRAMERNSLIYGFGHGTFVCSARYRLGGSWQGAVAALKAHRAVVVADWTSTGFASKDPKYAEGTYGLAQRALKNLGAYSLELDIASYKKDIDEKLDAALEWSFERYAGQINSGLFAS